MLGQGGPGDFPNPLEVFNTPAGALSYYQVEMRQHRRQSCAHFHEHHNAQRDNMQLQQQLQRVQQQLQLALLTQQASAREIAQLQQQLSTAQEEKVSQQQRRNVDLEKIRTHPGGRSARRRRRQCARCRWRSCVRTCPTRDRPWYRALRAQPVRFRASFAHSRDVNAWLPSRT